MLPACSLSYCLPAFCLPICLLPGIRCLKLTTEIIPHLTIALRYSIPSQSDFRAHFNELRGKTVRLIVCVSVHDDSAACSWEIVAADLPPSSGAAEASQPPEQTHMA